MAKPTTADVPLKSYFAQRRSQCFFLISRPPTSQWLLLLHNGLILLTQPALDEDDKIQTQIKFLLL